VGATADADVRYHQRLRVNLVVYRNFEQQSELVRVHIRRRQRGFTQVLSSSTEVIVLGDNINLGLPA
jgi:hypothetical protein